MKVKKHRYLRSRMMAAGLNSSDMAEALGKSQSWLSKRLNGSMEFSSSDMWRIMRLLGISPDEMALTFPDYGGAENEEIQSVAGGGWIPPVNRQLRRVGNGYDSPRPVRRTSGYRFDPIRTNCN